MWRKFQKQNENKKCKNSSFELFLIKLEEIKRRVSQFIKEEQKMSSEHVKGQRKQ